MIKKQILLFVVLLSLIVLFSQIETFDADSRFMVRNIILDFCVFFGYLFFLSTKDKFLFPSAIFILFFYVYEVLGKCVWLFREFSWFNEEGSPVDVAIYFSIIGGILIVCSMLNISFSKTNNPQNTEQKTIENNLFIRKRPLLILIFITFIGAFLFTSGFRIIPLLTSSMDESRVALATQSSGGRGIGFLLLLFGVLANSLALFTIKGKKGREKRFYIWCIIVITLFLSLYSGRFLPMIPFVLYFIINQSEQTFKYIKVIGYALVVITTFIVLMYFGAIRYYGADSTIDLIIRYLVADSFPEFRMAVYIHSMPEVNLFDNFFYTILAGLFPGFLFSLFGIDKNEYFRPIGAEILDMTHFNPASIPGIRTSLFGELSLTGNFIYVFIPVLCIILYYLDKSFFKIQTLGYSKYKKLSLAIFLGFSIPYGSLFLVSVIEWYVILIVVEKYFINGRALSTGKVNIL